MRRTPLTPMLLAGLLAAVPAYAQDAAGETGTGRPLPEKCRAAPPPPEGRTPVIRPDEIPDQPGDARQ